MSCCGNLRQVVQEEMLLYFSEAEVRSAVGGGEKASTAKGKYRFLA